MVRSNRLDYSLERSYERITKDDLNTLKDLALIEREHFFDRNPKYRGSYWNALIAIALCQGAALHFLDDKNGIKDFDIWYFYASAANVKYPPRAIKLVDSRMQKFGVNPNDVRKGYVGRRIHLLGRDINCQHERVQHDPSECIVQYLMERKTETARRLSEKAVIGLWPASIFGKIIWSKSEDVRKVV
jgi:hypothetical protein